ncbi:MAG: porin [Cereibacter sphaeroides]|uniref:Porin n=1 Tax=Cereibacter sphaeroides TaxID=1063 RepID=A0A2W5SDK3_CERSP|nr:MAG: porin [Cereibacter sphaeroides]
MRRSFWGRCLSLLIPLAASAATAQEVRDTNFDYDDLASEVPIESEVYGPALTYTSKTGVVTNFYGQVNLAYQSFDDGEETTSNVVDNGNWNSRLGFTVTQPLGEVTLRYRFETGLTMRNSGIVTQGDTPEWTDWQQTLLRWFEVAIDSNYGTLSLGQGASASDGTSGLDDSFTFVAGATNSTDGFGSLRFRDDNGDLTNVSIAQVNNAFNGARRFRIRYDTPVVQGWMLSTSYGVNILTESDENDYYDVAIRWTGDIGDFAVRTAAGYQWIEPPQGDTIRRVAASATVVHEPTGLNLAVSVGQQINGADFIWTRAGWQTEFFDVGTTSLSVDYYNGQDFLSEGARTENYGLYAVQSFDEISLDVYAGWRRFTYSDQLGNSYQDADGLLVGARWFF